MQKRGGAGDSVKPEVERGETPGQKHINSKPGETGESVVEMRTYQRQVSITGVAAGTFHPLCSQRFFNLLPATVRTGGSICRNMARVCGCSVPSNCPHNSSE